MGAGIIQAEYGFTDEETALMIQENPYLQYFCGYSGYDDERLTPEILGEINELILSTVESENDDDDHENGGNSGIMIVDATCAPSHIRYPQDASLLNEARENTERLLDELHDPADGRKRRTYRKQAHRDFLQFSRSRKKTAKEIRKAVSKQLRYLARNLAAIEEKLSIGRTLTGKQANRLSTIYNLYSQQKTMYDNHSHSIADRIVSVSQPFLCPIVRGKAGKPVEFGAKLDISVVNGWSRSEYFSFDAYNEAGNLQDMAERFLAREGYHPSRILADKIYRNRDNLRYCKEHGIHLTGPALGRPKKDELRDATQNFIDECERVEVERRFSLAKRKCGLGLIMAKLQDTIAHSVAMSILVLNLRKIPRAPRDALVFSCMLLFPRKNYRLFS